jgi:uncharacterized damage-inducible protein DinB
VFATVDQFLRLWAIESDLTSRVLAALTDEALRFGPVPDARTAGEIAWHIVTAIREIGGHAGFGLTGPDRKQPPPPRAAAILERYRHAAAELGTVVQSRTTGERLRLRVEAYGETWSVSGLLSVLIRHEIHHRGQLMQLMREAGLRLPAVYGPSRDEAWPVARGTRPNAPGPSPSHPGDQLGQHEPHEDTHSDPD